MISAWWLIPTAMAGAFIGVLLTSLCCAAVSTENEKKKEVKK